MIDPQDITDALEETTEEATILPEAPLSINITAYYKGFRVQFTKRSLDTEVTNQVSGVVGLVEKLVKNGYTPSWNVETNKQTLTPQTAVVASPVASDVPTCGVHGKPMKLVNGKWGDFWSCQMKNADGTYCKYRPNKS